MCEGNLSYLSSKIFRNLGITPNLETDGIFMRKKMESLYKRWDLEILNIDNCIL